MPGSQQPGTIFYMLQPMLSCGYRKVIGLKNYGICANISADIKDKQMRFLGLVLMAVAFFVIFAFAGTPSTLFGMLWRILVIELFAIFGFFIGRSQRGGHPDANLTDLFEFFKFLCGAIVFVLILFFMAAPVSIVFNIAMAAIGLFTIIYILK